MSHMLAQSKIMDRVPSVPARVWGRLGALALAALIGSASFTGMAVAKPSEKPFEVVPGSFHIVPSTAQAGAHEDLTTSFQFAHTGTGTTFRTLNDLKDTVVNLPPGFVGSNTAVPACPAAQLLGRLVEKGAECPPDTQVGTISFNLTLASEPVKVIFPVYNVEVTSFGVTAELGFNAIILTQTLTVNVRPGSLGLTVTAHDVEQTAEPNDVTVTIWGVPGAKSHDAERGRECYPNPLNSTNISCVGGNEQVNTAKPFLANPTSCGGTQAATLSADSWEQPGLFSGALSEIAPTEECERVPFDPSIEIRPTTEAAESPSGVNASVVVPQTWENSQTIATSNLKDATVALPEGFTVNPSAGSGLGACTPQEYEAETSSSLPGEGCPAESKIGSIEIETPLLAEKIPGAIYVAKPYDNVPAFGDPQHPGGSLLALYVVAKDPQRGILVKVAGKIEPNPVTGQLVTTFLNNPQQPFSKFTLKFRPGATAPLVSPPVCGSYSAQAILTPWSALAEQRLVGSTPFEITQGVHEGPCPAGGVPPLKPQVVSGTQNNAAGSYSPFYLRIVREDGEQEITKFSTIFPPGLSGNLTGVPFCPDSAIEAARQATGQRELSEPSCPVASEIGHSLTGAGVGTVLTWTPGKIYLAGPYHGAALSIVSVTSATVGPFDLGTVVIRFALRINPTTAQVEVDSTGSDPIPHIIDGIVVHVRDIHVYIDRPDFTLNPTSCSPQLISDTITGAGANPADPADQAPVSVNTRFQAADCQSLQFKPTFKVSTSGETSRAKGASLSVKLTYPNAPFGTQANIASVKVDLPKQLPSRLTTLQKACSDTTFNANPAACPAASRVGNAKAVTPILPVPLIGPAYFVSHGGAKFPELIIVLQGYGLTIDLHGETFISKQGITSSTFRTVPDQPVTSFELTLPQGTDSALAAPGGKLCQATHTIMVRKRRVVETHGRKHTVTKTVPQKIPGLQMPTAFTAQNGAKIRTSTPIAVTGCANRAKKASPPKRRQPHHP